MADKNTSYCAGKIHLSKRLLNDGVTDECLNLASQICEDCGKRFCHHHINRDKHKCDDSVKGAHSIWKEK